MTMRTPTAQTADPTMTPEPPAGPTSEALWRFVRRASVLGLAASVLVHVVLWVLAAVIEVPRSSDARIGGAGREVEFAVVTEAELAELMPESLAVSTPSVPEVMAPEVPAADLQDSTLSDAMLSPSQDLGQIVDRLGGGDVGVGDAGASGAGGGGAKFFGVEAQGNRFAFIVDISGSMALEGKIEALRRELIGSVDALFETAEFVVVAFSSGAYPLGGEPGWTDATDRGKRWARRSIENMSTMDATDPVPAFQIVTRMRPRPDAIYFMTDGEYVDSATLEIINMVSFDKIPVHCISFINPDAGPSMRQIAQASGGTYTHVPAVRGRP